MSKPGTSRHWTPSDGIESHHIEHRIRELEASLAAAERRAQQAEQERDRWWVAAKHAEQDSLALAREALAFYAKERDVEQTKLLLADQGRLAREALAALDGEGTDD